VVPVKIGEDAFDRLGAGVVRSRPDDARRVFGRVLQAEPPQLQQIVQEGGEGIFLAVVDVEPARHPQASIIAARLAMTCSLRMPSRREQHHVGPDAAGRHVQPGDRLRRRERAVFAARQVVHVLYVAEDQRHRLAARRPAQDARPRVVKRLGAGLQRVDVAQPGMPLDQVARRFADARQLGRARIEADGDRQLAELTCRMQLDDCRRLAGLHQTADIGVELAGDRLLPRMVERDRRIPSLRQDHPPLAGVGALPPREPGQALALIGVQPAFDRARRKRSPLAVAEVSPLGNLPNRRRQLGRALSIPIAGWRTNSHHSRSAAASAPWIKGA
jgi:hypothetical protein